MTRPANPRDRPSDRAIAAAFWESRRIGSTSDSDWIEMRSKQIDTEQSAGDRPALPCKHPSQRGTIGWPTAATMICNDCGADLLADRHTEPRAGDGGELVQFLQDRIRSAEVAIDLEDAAGDPDDYNRSNRRDIEMFQQCIDRLTQRTEAAPRDEAWRDLALRAWQLLDVECPNDPITEELLAALENTGAKP